MNAEQVLKLIDAGYSKEEINGMLAPEAPAEPEPTPEPEAPAEPEPAKPERQPWEDRLDKLEGIIEKMAEQNIKGSTAPEPKKRENVVAEVLKHL